MNDEHFFEILDFCNGCGACMPICPTKAIRIGDEHRCSIDYDICIKCGACARVCLNSCVVDSYGNVLQRVNKKYWDTPHFDATKCKSCGKCIEMCPAGILVYSSEQFATSQFGASSLGESLGKIPSITNSKLCASCHMCSKVCIFGAIDFFPVSKVNDTLDGSTSVNDALYEQEKNEEKEL